MTFNMTCFDASTEFAKDHFGTLNRRSSDAQPSGLGIQRLDGQDLGMGAGLTDGLA